MQNYKIEYLKLPYSLKNKYSFIEWFNKRNLVEQLSLLKIDASQDLLDNIKKIRLLTNSENINSLLNVEIEFLDIETNQLSSNFFLIPYIEYIVNIKPFNFVNVSFNNLIKNFHSMNMHQLLNQLNFDSKYFNDYVFRSIELYWSDQPNQVYIIFRLSKPYIFADNTTTKLFVYDLSQEQMRIQNEKIKINLNNYYFSFNAKKFLDFFDASFNLKEKLEKLGIVSDEFILSIESIKASIDPLNSRKVIFDIELYPNYFIKDANGKLVNKYQIFSNQFIDEKTTIFISPFNTKLSNIMILSHDSEEFKSWFANANTKEKIDFLQLDPVESQNLINDIVYASDQNIPNATRLIIFLKEPYKFTTGNRFQFLDIQKFKKSKIFFDLNDIYLSENFYNDFGQRNFISHFLFDLDITKRMEALNIKPELINQIDNILAYVNDNNSVRFEIKLKENNFFNNIDNSTISFISKEFFKEEIFEGFYVPKINISKYYYEKNPKDFCLDFWKETNLVKKLELLGIFNLDFASTISKILISPNDSDSLKIELKFKDGKSILFKTNKFRQNENQQINQGSIKLKEKFYNGTIDAFYNFFNTLDINGKINCFEFEQENLVEAIEYIVIDKNIFSSDKVINFYFKLKQGYSFLEKSWVFKYKSSVFVSKKTKLPSFNFVLSSFLYSQNINVILNYLNELSLVGKLQVLSLNSNDIFQESIKNITFACDEVEPNKIKINFEAKEDYIFNNFEQNIELKTSYFLPNMSNLPIFRSNLLTIEQTINSFEEEFILAALEKQKYMLNIQYQEFSKFISSMEIKRNNDYELFVIIKLMDGNNFEFVGPVAKERIANFVSPLSFVNLDKKRQMQIVFNLKSKIKACDASLYQDFPNYEDQLELLGLKNTDIVKYISSLSFNCINGHRLQINILLKPNSLFLENLEPRLSLDVDLNK